MNISFNQRLSDTGLKAVHTMPGVQPCASTQCERHHELNYNNYPRRYACVCVNRPLGSMH